MTRILGIVNLTPDSFSGDGFSDAHAAYRAIEQMAEQGAYACDIGAESTRPGATALSAKEEWQRLSPLLELLAKRKPLRVSVDTYHPENAARALELGADWINDVSGGSEEMFKRIAAADCRYVLMHSLGIPANPTQTVPVEDVVFYLCKWARAKLAQMQNMGIASSRVIFDPGIGFGKTPAQSWQITEGVAAFKALGVELLMGHSRKSFLVQKGANTMTERDAATLELSRRFVEQGVDYLRVHNIAAHRQLGAFA